MITEVELIDVKALNKIIKETYHIDFSDYATTSYRRRVAKAGNELNVPSMGALLSKVKEDKGFFDKFCNELVVETTEFFRDPSFWRKLREEILKNFKNNQQLRIWVAGCSSGEEVLSLAMLLKEEGMYEKTKITATEINELSLNKLKEAKYASKNIEIAQSNYERFEGKKQFAAYYKETQGMAEFDKSLLENVIFKPFLLGTGDATNKYDLILCRNVFIYFNPSLQEAVLSSFAENLFTGGLLAIGIKESIISTRSYNKFTEISAEEKIYKRK